MTPYEAVGAEQSVLSVCIADNTKIDEAAALLAPHDFGRAGYGRAFALLLSERAAGRVVDMVRFPALVHGRPDYGSTAEMLALLDDHAGHGALVSYCGDVRKAAARRCVRAVLRGALDDVPSAGDLGALCKRVAEQLRAGSTPGVVDAWGDWQPVGRDWLDQPPPLRRWLLYAPAETLMDGHGRTRESTRGCLPLGKVGILAAAGGIGKTMAVCDLAVAVASGRAWLGAFPVATGGRVLVLLGEEDAEEARRRMHGAAAGLDDAGRERVARDVVVAALAGNPRIALSHSEQIPGDVETPATRTLVRRITDTGPWSLIVLDPSSRFAGPDVETSNAAATRFLQVLERLAQAPGTPTIILVHHTSQGARKDGNHDATALRGVTGMSDAARWVATLSPIDAAISDFARLAIVKHNYSGPIPPVVLRRSERGGLHVANCTDLADLERMRTALAERAGESAATTKVTKRRVKAGSSDAERRAAEL